MIIMKIMGGFASQFTKFMLGYLIAEYKQEELVLDLSDYFNGYFRPYSLCYMNLPNCRIITDINEAQIRNMVLVRNSNDFCSMIENFNKKKNYYLDREEDDYREALAQFPCIQLHPDISILKRFDFRGTTGFFNCFKEKIEKLQTAAVHVRRGDFLKLGWQDDTNFYMAAIAWLCEKNPDINFYFFSNDLSWVRNTFGFNDKFHYVSSIDGNEGDVQELFCISECNYRILSRFSGYGRLANILSAAKGNNGFAIMDATVISRDIEGQNEAECIGKKYAEEIKAEKVVKQEDGGIVFLDESLINKYVKKYKSIMPIQEAQTAYTFNNSQRLTQRDLDEIGTDLGNMDEENYNMLMHNRYLNYVDVGDRARQRECLEKMPVNEVTKSLWRYWYGLDTQINTTVCICSEEQINRWKMRGMYQAASILAKCGVQTLYLNLNLRKRKVNKLVIKEASDMDGRKLAFQIAQFGEETPEKCGNDFINERLRKSNLIIADSRFGIKYMKKIGVEKKKIIFAGAEKKKSWLIDLCGSLHKISISDKKELRQDKMLDLSKYNTGGLQYMSDIDMPTIISDYIEKSSIKLIEGMVGVK